MANNNKNIIFGILVFAIIIFFFLGNSAGVFSSVGGTVTRDVSPSKVRTGDTISLIYTISGTGAYGVSILDSVTGGCTFPDGEIEFRTVVLSEDSQKVILNIKAPESPTTCTFKGDFKFGTQNIIKMVDDVVIIVEEDEVECEIDSDCSRDETCEGNLCIKVEDEDSVDVLEDTFLNNLAVNILGLDVDELGARTAKTYILLFYAGALLVLFFLIKLIFSTPK